MTFDDEANLWRKCVGETLQQIRLKKRLSGRQLRAIVGIANFTLVEIENGRTGFRITTAYKLATALGVSFELLAQQAEKMMLERIRYLNADGSLYDRLSKRTLWSLVRLNDKGAMNTLADYYEPTLQTIILRFTNSEDASSNLSERSIFELWVNRSKITDPAEYLIERAKVHISVYLRTHNPPRKTEKTIAWQRKQNAMGKRWDELNLNRFHALVNILRKI